LLLAFAPVAVAVPAGAQTAADDPTTDMARARFKEGVGFYDKAQYEQARAAFLQAYALKKHPAVLLNLAWSCLKSGHTLEAEHYFKQFLTEGKDITDKQKSDAVDGLNQAHAKLGRIEVVAAVGTDVTIDGDKAGTAPLPEPIIVEPGAHTIKFRGPDGATDTDSVTVLAGEKAIARFAKTASAAPPAAANPPTTPSSPDGDNTTPPTTPPEEAPAPQVKAPPKEDTDHESHTGFIVPIVIASVVTVGGVVLAGVMAASKSNAQNKANAIALQIRNAGGTSCNPPTPNSISHITDACNQFIADNNDVNTDATVGNIAVGVAVVGAIAVAGLVVWDVLSSSHHDNSAAAKNTSRPTMAPILGRDVGGLSLSGSF
jgi:hypothetical protein